MSSIEALLEDLADNLFRDLCTSAVLAAAEQNTDSLALWPALEEAGLASALDPEADDPRTLSPELISVILRAAGKHALPLPLAETYAAQRMALASGLDLIEGPVTVATQRLHLAPVAGGWLASGNLRQVPYGHVSRAILAIGTDPEGRDHAIWLAGLTPSLEDKNLAGEPRDGYRLDACFVGAAAVRAAPQRMLERLIDEMRLMRSALLVGAMSTALGLTIRHATERVQFGRPIARFQAIQHQVAEMAAQVASAAAATEAAFTALAERDAHFEILAAKIRASEAAGIVARIAHQVHGAMGMTHEHPLHFSTRRIWSWRDDYGSESVLAVELGRLVLATGPDDLWLMMTPPALATGEAA